MPNGRDSRGKFTDGRFSGLTPENRRKGTEASHSSSANRDLRIKWNAQFLQQFVDIWNEVPLNAKGQILRDENNEPYYVGNGQYALRQLAQKSPDKFVKLGAEVFKALQPKTVQNDIGDNLAHYLENMGSGYAIDVTPDKKLLEN